MHESKDGEASTSTLAVARHHSLYTFGRNFHGQLGSGDFEDRPSPQAVSLGFQPCQSDATLEEETTAAVVACGIHHSACMSRRGELFSWGMCRNGELGQGRWASIEVQKPIQCFLPQLRVVSISCGANHTLAIGESGSLWSCGSNVSGQLGNGTFLDSPHLNLVQNLPGVRMVSTAAGTAHSVALASDGSLYTWGDGTRGQLGHSQLQSMATAQNSIILLLPQKIQRLDPNHLSPVDRVTAMSARGFHTLVLTVGGSVLGFGANSSGQLGLGDTADRWKPTRVNLAMPGEEGCCIKVIQIACGAQHSVALVSKQGRTDIRTTGANTWGQLGVGDLAPRLRFTATLPVQRVTAVQAGDEHCAAVTEEGQLYMWGRGDSGQLGLGDLACRQSPSLLEGFSVVHPDYTLRRSNRIPPVTRGVTGRRPAVQASFLS
jgi:E3 ubiquitin-protein ligase HERC3